MNKRTEGSIHEREVCRYLKAEGMQILCRNFRCRSGEIDIIAMDGNCLVFTEVKYRSGRRCGDPLEAVDYHKQYRICRVADFYLVSRHIPRQTPCRFDAASVCADGIRLVRNAFWYIPPRKGY